MPNNFIISSEKPRSNRKYLFPIITGFLILLIITFLALFKYREIRREQVEKGIRQKAVTPQEVAEKAQSQRWDYQTQEINSTVMDINRPQESLLLHVSWPPKVPFVGRDVWIKIACSDEDILLVTNSSDPTKKPDRRKITKGELFSTVSKKDFFFGICSDVFCEVINHKCELQHRI